MLFVEAWTKRLQGLNKATVRYICNMCVLFLDYGILFRLLLLLLDLLTNPTLTFLRTIG